MRQARTWMMACMQDEDVDMDCVAQFQAMQQCMAKHPDAFAEFADFQQSGDAERLAQEAKAG
jgi:ferric-dicitrate binding protein FerR (iron transport regulator)